MNLVKIRKDFVTKELPQNMEGLCGDGVELLFGDNLSSSIKEVSELNKVSRAINNRFINARGRGVSRGRFRGFRRSGRRFFRRNVPYNKNLFKTGCFSEAFKPEEPLEQGLEGHLNDGSKIEAVGGRLVKYLQFWNTLTSDDYILECI